MTVDLEPTEPESEAEYVENNVFTSETERDLVSRGSRVS